MTVHSGANGPSHVESLRTPARVAKLAAAGGPGPQDRLDYFDGFYQAGIISGTLAQMLPLTRLVTLQQPVGCGHWPIAQRKGPPCAGARCQSMHTQRPDSGLHARRRTARTAAGALLRCRGRGAAPRLGRGWVASTARPPLSLQFRPHAELNGGWG